MGEAKRRKETGAPPLRKGKSNTPLYIGIGVLVVAAVVFGLVFLTAAPEPTSDELPVASANAEAFPAQLDQFGVSVGREDAPRVAAISTVTPTFASSVVEMPDIATDSAAADGIDGHSYRGSLAVKAYEEAGIGPEDVDFAEVYDLSTALELDWIEDLQLADRGEAAKLLRQGDTSVGGKIPVNASGGLACFGEAVPAQAIAQICELTWQLRGQAGDRQIAGARVGITANQGLFGHGSSVIVKR